VLSIEKGVVPPNANFETLNPDIDDEFFNLNVSKVLMTPAETIFDFISFR
jgi:acyl transferase domain-containing protein